MRERARLFLRRLAVRAVVFVLAALTLTACSRPAPASSTGEHTVSPPAVSPPAAVVEARDRSRDHDLSVDERMGGHTLARHVGKTDAELVDRLRREPDISSASAYLDRETAEQVVGAALVAGGRGFEAWQSRHGRRPNFVLHYSAPKIIGRSMSRRRTASVPCEYALVVLRWDERHDQFYVLTSYPEEHR